MYVFIYLFVLGFICKWLSLDSKSKEKSIFIWLRFIICFWPPKIAHWVHNSGKVTFQDLAETPESTWPFLGMKPSQNTFLCFFFLPSLGSNSQCDVHPYFLYRADKSKQSPGISPVGRVACGLGVNPAVWAVAGNMGMNPKMMVAALTERCWHCWKNIRALFCHTPIRPFLSRFPMSS